MIVAVDIGNTNIVVGFMDNERIYSSLRISTDRKKTWQEYLIMLKVHMQHEGILRDSLQGGIVSSVVPSLRQVFRTCIEELSSAKCLVVGPGIKTSLNIKMDNPSSLGSDLVVDAVAAIDLYGSSLAIFDLGTATTMSVIDKDRNYVGGCICTGLRIGVDALSGGTSSLPYIDLSDPGKIIGKNTLDCMKSGAILGHAAMMDGLLTRAEEELGYELQGVATGGLVSLVLPYCKKNIKGVPDLLLHGLRLLYEKNI